MLQLPSCEVCLYICNLRWPGGCCWGSACWFICTCCLLPLSLGGLFVHLRHTRCMLQLLLRSSCFGFVCSCCMYDPIFVCVCGVDIGPARSKGSGHAWVEGSTQGVWESRCVRLFSPPKPPRLLARVAVCGHLRVLVIYPHACLLAHSLARAARG